MRQLNRRDVWQLTVTGVAFGEKLHHIRRRNLLPFTAFSENQRQRTKTRNLLKYTWCVCVIGGALCSCISSYLCWTPAMCCSLHLGFWFSLFFFFSFPSLYRLVENTSVLFAVLPWQRTYLFGISGVVMAQLCNVHVILIWCVWMLQGHVSRSRLAPTFSPFKFYAQNNLQNNLKETGTNKRGKALQVRRCLAGGAGGKGIDGARLGRRWQINNYLAITCAIRQLEDVKQGLSANRCTSVSGWRGSVFLSVARV